MNPVPPEVAGAPPRADLRFLLRSPWHFLALGCASGLSPVAPGTAGSLFGWVTYLGLQSVLAAWAWQPLLLLGFVGGVWICGLTARALGLHDPSPVVWDEIVAMWLVLWVAQRAVEAMGSGASLPWEMQLAAFALFRLFDAVKRGPVGWVDRKVGGGLGIMLDDLVAALLALLALGAGSFLLVCIELELHGIRLVM